MANTSVLQVRVNTKDKEKASEILESLGTNVSAVVNMLIRQIIITEGIPFDVKRLSTISDGSTPVPDKAGDIMVIPALPVRIIPAIEYTNMICKIPAGKVSRYDDINNFFKAKYDVESVEPEYSGWPTYDNEGKRIPYWRVIGSRGAVTGANWYKADMQQQYLAEEGIEIVPYKKSYRVVDYKRYLFNFSGAKGVK